MNTVKSTRALNIIALLVLAMLYGCQPSTSESTLTRSKSFYSLGGLMSAGMNPSNADAILDFGGSVIYNDLQTNNYVVTAGGQATFTNDTSAHDVTSVILNSSGLVREYQGQYTTNSFTYPSPFQADWTVNGYEGSNVSDLSDDLNEIRITGRIAGDSVVKSNGFTISYNGSNGGDLSVDIYFDMATTSVFGDTSIASNGQGVINKTVTDNGSFTISTSDLVGFTTGGYIRVNIAHWEYHTVTATNGRELGIYNRYSASIPLFLKP